MIFAVKALCIRRQASQRPILDFMNYPKEPEGGQSYKREVLFTRYIGEDTPFLETIRQMDEHFLRGQRSCQYVRVSSLNHVVTPKESDTYIEIYDQWLKKREALPQERFALKFPIRFQNDTIEWTQKCAFEKTILLFEKTTPHYNASIMKNFAIKLLGWISFYLPKLINGRELGHPKFVYVGTIKRQELLFLYFLSLMGCDVLYMNPVEDIDKLYPESKLFSDAYLCANKCQVMPTIPSLEEYVKIHLKPSSQKEASLCEEQVNTSAPAITKSSAENVQKVASKTPTRTDSGEVKSTRELSYEELAKLSTSIVMIGVLNHSGEIVGSGSGVIIHNQGYILTNFHVVRGGAGFVVRFENEEDSYVTNRVVKYHEDYDLAVIKVEKQCLPIPVYIGDHLVRGQNVVAIGSPMGLFNTISDGIISAFRQTSKVPMIQFTAPISHGSSGGAVLDMYGRLIGISTSGFDDGQNLNLAVDNHTLYTFANQFIEICER